MHAEIETGSGGNSATHYQGGAGGMKRYEFRARPRRSRLSGVGVIGAARSTSLLRVLDQRIDIAVGVTGGTPDIGEKRLGAKRASEARVAGRTQLH